MRIRQTLFSGLLFLALSAPLAAQPLVWEPIDLPVEDTLIEIFAADGQFIAHGEGGTVLRSADGRVWEDVSVPTTSDLTHGVQWNGRWLVSGPDAGIWVSADQGLNWAQAQLPVLEGQMFRPESLVVQSNGELLSIGDLPASISDSFFENPCWRTAATSEDGLDWQLRDDIELFGEHRDAIVVGDGIVNAIYYGTLPECSSIPIISAYDLRYYTGDAATGFTLVEDPLFITSLGVVRRAVVWHQEQLWWIGRSLVAPSPDGTDQPWEYQDWLRADPLMGFNPEPEQINLTAEVFSLDRYGDRLLAGHIGRISLVSPNGEVEEFSLPVADAWFRFASRDGVLVGVGEGGVAVRGSLPLSLPVPLDQRGFLLWFGLLVFLAGLGSLPGRRSS